MVKLMVKSHRELRRPFDTHPGPALALRGREGARAPRQPPKMPASHLADGGFARMMGRILRRAEQPAESGPGFAEEEEALPAEEEEPCVFSWEFTAADEADMPVGHSGGEDSGGELDADMDEASSVHSDAPFECETDEAPTGQAAVNAWYMGDINGWESETGLLVQPRTEEGVVRLYCPEQKLRNGGSVLHWAARVDRALLVTVRRSANGSFEQECSCADDVMNAEFAQGGGCEHVGRILRCARRAVHSGLHGGEDDEDHAYDEVEAADAWGWVLRLPSHARRLEAPLPKAAPGMAGVARKRQKGPASVHPISDEDVSTIPRMEPAAAPDAPWCTVGKNVEAMWEMEWWQARIQSLTNTHATVAYLDDLGDLSADSAPESFLISSGGIRAPTSSFEPSSSAPDASAAVPPKQGLGRARALPRREVHIPSSSSSPLTDGDFQHPTPPPTSNHNTSPSTLNPQL